MRVKSLLCAFFLLLLAGGMFEMCIRDRCRTNRGITETQVRTSETTWLLGVVREVSLAVLVGVVTDNLNRVLVGAYCTVGSQTVVLSLEHAFAAQCDFFFLRKRSESNVVHNTDSEEMCIRDSNPIIAADKECRDPNMFWHEKSGKWILILAAALEKEMWIYSSPDVYKRQV